MEVKGRGRYQRTMPCGRVSSVDVGKKVTLCGWVRRRRDHGGLIFVDLSDFSGYVQLVVNPDSPAAFSLGEKLRSEYVIKIEGEVTLRPVGTVNAQLATGEIEVNVSLVEILSEAQTLPFVIQDEVDAKEELRLKYRYLDLRRPCMQQMLRLRHAVCRATRNYLDAQEFVEVETPILTKPTPEGARDFLVPSRISRGEFYALPQSPQLFKQVLMCASLDRYYQIVRCFRDEDLRANRQPEFTQVDIEMSFVEEPDVKQMVEGLVQQIWRDVAGVELKPPFLTISYDEAMARFGVDAPDMRYPMELTAVGGVFAESDFQAFRQVLQRGGVIKGIRFENGGETSRKELDEWTEFVKIYGAQGLAWFKVEQGKEIKSPIAKFLSAQAQQELSAKFSAEAGDLLLIVGGEAKVVNAALAALRQKIARDKGLIDNQKLAFLWVERFPLLELDAELGRYVSVHHPFTSPVFANEAELAQLESAPDKMCARAYDLVLNGQEIAGGSIRIHRADVQQRVFNLLKIDETEAREKFGFLLDALSYGAPPHGGIALGLDRIIMILSGAESIRDVIAFPKTQRGQDLMVDAPAKASVEQLLELGIKVIEREQGSSSR